MSTKPARLGEKRKSSFSDEKSRAKKAKFDPQKKPRRSVGNESDTRAASRPADGKAAISKNKTAKEPKKAIKPKSNSDDAAEKALERGE